MNAGINGQTYFETAKSSGTTATESLAQHRLRIPCPRCIGGSMFHDRDDEYVCIQCGFSHYPERIGKTKPAANNGSNELTPLLVVESTNISRNHSSGTPVNFE
jgi:ribosomal protein S27AE